MPPHARVSTGRPDALTLQEPETLNAGQRRPCRCRCSRSSPKSRVQRGRVTDLAAGTPPGVPGHGVAAVDMDLVTGGRFTACLARRRARLGHGVAVARARRSRCRRRLRHRRYDGFARDVVALVRGVWRDDSCVARWHHQRRASRSRSCSVMRRLARSISCEARSTAWCPTAIACWCWSSRPAKRSLRTAAARAVRRRRPRHAAGHAGDRPAGLRHAPRSRARDERATPAFRSLTAFARLRHQLVVDPCLQFRREILDLPIDLLEVVAIGATPLEHVAHGRLGGPGDAADLLDRLEPHRFSAHRAILSFGHTCLLSVISARTCVLDKRRRRSPHYAVPHGTLPDMHDYYRIAEISGATRRAPARAVPAWAVVAHAMPAVGATHAASGASPGAGAGARAAAGTARLRDEVALDFPSGRRPSTTRGAISPRPTRLPVRLLVDVTLSPLEARAAHACRSACTCRRCAIPAAGAARRGTSPVVRARARGRRSRRATWSCACRPTPRRHDAALPSCAAVWAAGAPRRATRRPVTRILLHVQLLGRLYVVAGLARVPRGHVARAARHRRSQPDGMRTGPEVAASLAAAIFFACAAIALVWGCVLLGVGWALPQHQPWARPAALSSPSSTSS